MTNPHLAYWDSPSGLLPCWVERVEQSPDPDWRDPHGFTYCVVARVTVDRGPYRRGDRITQSPTNIWPRDCVRAKRGTHGQTKIVVPYDWHKRMEGAVT